MKKPVLLSLAAALTLSTAAPVFAAEGALGSVASFFGSVTATVIDVPQAIVVDSLWWQPRRTQKLLAEHFGDEKGLQQNVAGAALGWPWGVVWGIPSGALRGAKHGMSVGWEKPFSGESFIVISNEEK